ncbi:MAG: hypothetical protein KDD69_11540, partial [Bdellovibrionales bacterium]|nr:hypothetical protein [Bdellovibrionales bacterium]
MGLADRQQSSATEFSLPSAERASLFVRLDLPGDRSTYFSARLPIRGWLLGPAGIDISSIQLSVLLEEQQSPASVLRAGLPIAARVLPFHPTASVPHVVALELEPATFKDPSGLVVGASFSYRGELDIEALRPFANGESRVFFLSVRAECGELVSVSNTRTFGTSDRAALEHPLGGFLLPTGGSTAADVLVIEGWAAKLDDAVDSVILLVDGEQAAALHAHLPSPEQELALPEIAGAAQGRFAGALSRRTLIKQGLDERRLRNGVALGAECRFASGLTWRMTGPAVRWEPAPEAPVEGRVESVTLTADGQLSWRGWVRSIRFESTPLKLSWGRHSLAADGSEEPSLVTWSHRDDIVSRYPADWSYQPAGFDFRISPRALGSLPLGLRLSAIDPVGGEERVLPPRAFAAVATELCRLDAQSAVRDLPGAELLGRILRPATTTAPDRQPLRRLLVATHNLAVTEGAPKVLHQVLAHFKQVRPELELLVVSPRDGELRTKL